MGDTATDRASEVLLNQSENPIGNLQPRRIGNISDQVCYGHIFLTKRSLGDTIYIGFGGLTPSSSNYHVILTDDFPNFDDGVVIGDVTALGSTAGSILTTYARGGFWNKQG